MYVIWSLVLLLCFTGRVADGFSSGAPPSRCDNMVPAHRTGPDQILPQRSPLPYNFQLSKFTYSPGEQITSKLYFSLKNIELLCHRMQLNIKGIAVNLASV